MVTIVHRYAQAYIRNPFEGRAVIGMCERGPSLPRIVDWPWGIGSGQPGVRSASPSCPAGLIPLDDVGGDSAALAQIALVVGATDPESHRLIRRSVAGILFEDGRLSSPPSWLPGRRLATAQYRSPLAVINSAPRPPPTPADSGGAKRGASTGRRQATPGDSQRRVPQLDRLSDHAQPRAATARMRLKSGRSAVRPRP
jgi:hypothetical protein